jgi:hypothetical protein
MIPELELAEAKMPKPDELQPDKSSELLTSSNAVKDAQEIPSSTIDTANDDSEDSGIHPSRRIALAKATEPLVDNPDFPLGTDEPAMMSIDEFVELHSRPDTVSVRFYRQ